MKALDFMSALYVDGALGLVLGVAVMVAIYAYKERQR